MRHEGLLGVDPVPGGFLFTYADGSAPIFVPLDPGVPVPAAGTGDGAAARSDAKAVATPASSRPAASATDELTTTGRRRDEEADAIKALVKLELKTADARELVRRAKESLASRGAPIEAGALVHEALCLMPSPGDRWSA